MSVAIIIVAPALACDAVSGLSDFDVSTDEAAGGAAGSGGSAGATSAGGDGGMGGVFECPTDEDDVYLGPGGRCYWHVRSGETWTDAVDACAALGAHLMTITSPEERSFVDEDIDITASAWIGASDRMTEGTFEWVTGEPFTPDFWGPGQPDNTGSGGEQDCVLVRDISGNDNDDFDDVECDSSRNLICER